MEAAEDLYDIYLPLIRHEQQIGFGLTTLGNQHIEEGDAPRDPWSPYLRCLSLLSGRRGVWSGS